MHGRLIAPTVGLAILLVGASPVAAREPYPHEFHHNMGYCAPYLAQLRLPDGAPVRPWINHLVHDLTMQFGSFEGQKNVGDLYSDRARSETDQTCVARS